MKQANGGSALRPPSGRPGGRFIRGLKRRGLSGMEMAPSDAHDGLVQALREAFPSLIRQRCQAHFRSNVIDPTPSGYRDRMHQILDQLLEASSQRDMHRRFEEVSGEITEKAPAALEVLEEGTLRRHCRSGPARQVSASVTDNRHCGAVHRRNPQAREGHPHLPELEFRREARGRIVCGNLRRVVYRQTVPDDGRVLRMEEAAPRPRPSDRRVY